MKSKIIGTIGNRMRGRLAVAAICALIVTALATSVGYAGEPGGQAPDGKSKQADSPTYAMCGDCVNEGFNSTIFRSLGGHANCVWCFDTESFSPDFNTALKGESIWSISGTGVVGVGSFRGVYGLGRVTTGNVGGGDGVVGETAIQGKTGVFGINTGPDGNGVFGHSPNGTGVVGLSNRADRAGTYGRNDIAGGYGVYGTSTNGNGVYGTSSAGVALFGSNTGNGSGFYGFSVNGPGGVMGSNGTEGARFYSRNLSSYALVTGGLSNTTGSSLINGNLDVTGSCCARVGTSDGDRHMYATEATQAIFSDQGVAQLVKGKATITIDPLYAQTVNLREDYLVFLTPRSADTLGLAVVSQSPTSFEVSELGGGHGSYRFNWLIDAPRKGYEGERMAPTSPAPTSDGKAYELPVVPAQPVIPPGTTR